MPSSRRAFLKVATAASLPAQSPAKISDREYWLSVLRRLSDPVLSALSKRRLKIEMPVEVAHANEADRRHYTYLEAIGRLLAGIAPWIEHAGLTGSEEQMRRQYAGLARDAIAAAVDPASPDHMNFSEGSQPVVDAAFLALAVLRAPTQLWRQLDLRTQTQLVTAMKSSRVIRPSFSNWLLFSATIEAFLAEFTGDWDAMRVDYALRQHGEWYKGDGLYGDGPALHWDYYNSFVIHPMMLTVLDAVTRKTKAWDSIRAEVLERAVRYATIQERLISPEGTFPAIGRSITYRCGAFHHLATMALREQLAGEISPEQVRCALTAVMRRMMEAPGTFDAKGWLTIGFCGHQPSASEAYISTGSLYLCSAVLLPLGLPAGNRFWNGAARPWTAQNAWSGQPFPIDHAIRS